MSFAIITDSTSDISPARAQELGIYVIPLHVIIEGEDLLRAAAAHLAAKRRRVQGAL